MGAKTDAQKVAALRNAYVHQGLALEVAAQAAGVPERTARNIKARRLAEKDDWDKARAIHFRAGEQFQDVVRGVLEEYLRLHQSTIDDLKADEKATSLQKAEAISRLADAWTKTMNAAGRFAPEVQKLALLEELLRELATFVTTKFPQHAGALLEILEPFGAHAAERLRG